MRGFNKDSIKPGDVIKACGFAPKSTPGAAWLNGADRVITARLLRTQDGPNEHWSHYGPLELCISEKELDPQAQ